MARRYLKLIKRKAEKKLKDYFASPTVDPYHIGRFKLDYIQSSPLFTDSLGPCISLYAATGSKYSAVKSLNR